MVAFNVADIRITRRLGRSGSTWGGAEIIEREETCDRGHLFEDDQDEVHHDISLMNLVQHDMCELLQTAVIVHPL